MISFRLITPFFDGYQMTYKWTSEIEDEICEQISNNVMGLDRIIAKNSHWPKKDLIREHRINNDVFSGKYARAKAWQAELMADEVIDIADDARKDTIQDQHGNDICNNEWVQRSRVRIDSRKWILAKLLPKIYGDTIKTSMNLRLNVLTDSIDVSCDKILIALADGKISTEEATAAFALLTRHAELAKVADFGARLAELQRLLEARTNNPNNLGVIINGQKALEDSSEKESDGIISE